MNSDDIYPSEIAEATHYLGHYRPQYHYTPIQGHIGDATGLITYKGEYHMFYMYDPWSLQRREHKNWGHAVSRDCLHWQELPPILDTLIDHKPGSGSGVVDWNNSSGLRRGIEKALIVFYTDYVRGTCMAYSNDRGRTWLRHKSNPVLQGTEEIRDPTVFWYKPAHEWRMVRYEKKGFAFYASSNLVDWTYLSHIDGFYECPDIFQLPVDGHPENKMWVLIDGGGTYVVGSFDGERFQPETEKLRVNPGTNILEPITGDLFDIYAEIEIAEADAFGFEIRGERIRYRVNDRKLAWHDVSPLEPINDRIKLRILVDRSSIEIFGNDGRLSVTDLFFPDGSNEHLELFAEGGDVRVVSLEVNRLESIWQERNLSLGYLPQDRNTP